jgi:hypothetical protein
MPTIENNPYKNAIGINEGACNPLGITKSLARDVQDLADDARLHGGISTEKLAQHPVMVIYLTQLVHLCQGVIIPDDRPGTDYSHAIAECRRLAPEWDRRYEGHSDR